MSAHRGTVALTWTASAALYGPPSPHLETVTASLPPAWQSVQQIADDRVRIRTLAFLR